MNMKKILLYVLLPCLLPACSEECGITPVDLTCEYVKGPVLIDVPDPRFSWINVADAGERGQYQTGYIIQVAGSKESLLAGSDLLWTYRGARSPQSVNIRYKGPSLKSGQEYWWHVRVQDRRRKLSDWSDPACFRVGLTDPSEWKAEWIGVPWQGEEALPKPSNPGVKLPSELPPPAPLLRKQFDVNKKVARAIAYTSGLGYFELYLNGSKVGNDVLIPNQTNYGKRPGLENENIPLPDNFREYRVMYMAYDITDNLITGSNAVGAMLGNGFYNPAKYWCGAYGSPRFLLQLHITYEDGTREIIVSDDTWKVAEGPVVMDMIFYGEHYDARLELEGWCSPGFNDSGWQNAVVRKAPEGKLTAHTAQTDMVMEVLDPVKIEKLESGNYKIDFGQEISGWIHLKDINGDAGRKIEIRYLQPYSPNGENTYILKGGGPESYHARFTWFVFREVEILNWPGELNAGQVQAEAVYTGVETTGKFTSSNKMLEDINRIWWRSQTDNMHGGIASDCPNRERSPYTGDGQVACVTVMHNFDSRAFYRKWIDDIIGASNEETGYVPNGAPWQPGCGGGVAWGAAICIMPWEFYIHYGDENILTDSYEAMKGYVRYMLTWTDEKGIMFSQAPGRNGKPLRWLNLGDWVAPFELPPDNMVHTFYLWRCADITSETAKILGNKTEAVYYRDLADRTKAAFMNEFWDEASGSYGKYGGNIFALRMGVPEDRKERVISALKNDIEANGGHLDTGIFGTQFFFEVLAENGLNEMAYTAMNKRTMPSYGYWLEQGATTSWEHWDRGGSGNHPMFGGGLVWLYRNLAGMKTDPEFPGYRHVIFRPQPAGDVTMASYSNLTPYGNCSVKWEKKNGSFVMETVVPAGCRATVYVPAESKNSVTESGKKATASNGVSFKGMEEGYAVYKTGSGHYSFESRN